MITINEILPKLKGVKKAGNGYLAFCPAHDDFSNRSLSLTERDGTLLMHCFVGCSFGDILGALGYSKEHFIIQPAIEAIYDYTDEEGNLLYQSIRYYPKSFKQRRPDGKGDYIWDLKGIEPVLYQLPLVIEAVSNNRMVFIVEGEKDCLNLGYHGRIATTNSGGASAEWQPQYTEALRNARITIIPDNDTPGRKHAEKIASFLYGWASSLKVLGLGAKDITEWLKEHNPDELGDLWKSAKEYIPIGAVTRDEFQELKGHLIFVHDILKAKGDRRRYKDYVT